MKDEREREVSKQNGNMGSPLPLLTPGAVIFLGERKIGRGVGGFCHLCSLSPCFSLSHTWFMWKFEGQRWKLCHHSLDLSHNSDNAGSLTPKPPGNSICSLSPWLGLFSIGLGKPLGRPSGVNQMFALGLWKTGIKLLHSRSLHFLAGQRC